MDEPYRPPIGTQMEQYRQSWHQGSRQMNHNPAPQPPRQFERILWILPGHSNNCNPQLPISLGHCLNCNQVRGPMGTRQEFDEVQPLRNQTNGGNSNSSRQGPQSQHQFTANVQHGTGYHYDGQRSYIFHYGECGACRHFVPPQPAPMMYPDFRWDFPNGTRIEGRYQPLPQRHQNMPIRNSNYILRRTTHQNNWNAQNDRNYSANFLSPPLTEISPNNPTPPSNRSSASVMEESKITKQEQLNILFNDNNRNNSSCTSTVNVTNDHVASENEDEQSNQHVEDNENLPETENLESVKIVAQEEQKKTKQIQQPKKKSKKLTVNPAPSKKSEKKFNAKYFAKLPKKEQQKLFGDYDSSRKTTKRKKCKELPPILKDSDDLKISDEMGNVSIAEEVLSSETITTLDVAEVKTSSKEELYDLVDSEESENDVSTHNFVTDVIMETKGTPSNSELIPTVETSSETGPIDQTDSINPATMDSPPNLNSAVDDKAADRNGNESESGDEHCSSDPVEKSSRKRKRKNKKQRKKAAVLRMEEASENQSNSETPTKEKFEVLTLEEVFDLQNTYGRLKPVRTILNMYIQAKTGPLIGSEYLPKILHFISVALKPCLEKNNVLDMKQQDTICEAIVRAHRMMGESYIAKKIEHWYEGKLKYSFDLKVEKFISDRQKKVFFTRKGMEKRALNFLHKRSVNTDCEYRHFYAIMIEKWDTCFAASLYYLSLETMDEQKLRSLEQEFFRTFSCVPDVDDNVL